jgi:hypothetical protein
MAQIQIQRIWLNGDEKQLAERCFEEELDWEMGTNTDEIEMHVGEVQQPVSFSDSTGKERGKFNSTVVPFPSSLWIWSWPPSN